MDELDEFLDRRWLIDRGSCFRIFLDVWMMYVCIHTGVSLGFQRFNGHKSSFNNNKYVNRISLSTYFNVVGKETSEKVQRQWDSLPWHQEMVYLEGASEVLQVGGSRY